MQITIDFNSEQIYKILNQLDVKEKLNLVKRLEKETFEYRLNKLQKSITQSDFSEIEILSEIKSVRKNENYF